MEQLGKHFKKIAGPALTRHGLAYADLLAAWDDILGPELARHCLPEKLTLPRGEKTGGQLVLRVRFGRALDVQYQGPRIIERINQFCGFQAVGSLKVLQGQLPEAKIPPKAPALDAASAKALESGLSGVDDARLRQALAKLGAGALASSRKGRS